MERSRTIAQLTNHLEGLGVTVPAETLTELEASVREAVSRYFMGQKRLRPSAMARELRAMAKGLNRASNAAQRMGEQGMLHLYAASNANREPDNWDPSLHVDYLTRMARWAERAADTAIAEVKSTGDDRGGRTPDEKLRSLMVILLTRFQELLGIRPLHSVNVDTGLGDSIFDMFAKSAITEFAPGNAVIPDGRQIDDAIRWALPSRDSEMFTPPAD
jgi:hypothetical protein